MFQFRRVIVCGLWVILLTGASHGAEQEENDALSILREPDPLTSTTTASPSPPTHSDPRLSQLGLGLAYLGGQVRWKLSSRWAMEGRYQTGKASSNYGDVTAQVFGARVYRFRRSERRMPLYWGLELDYSTAKPETSSYKTSGPVMGAFGGLEYRMGRRFALDLDIGPYVIALKENRTNTSQTSLDFVVNTALMVYLF